MAIYAVHRKLPGISMEDLGNAQKLAIQTGEKMTAEGKPVSYVKSQFYPGNSTCTCFFESDNENAVKELNQSASLPFDTIEEVLELNP